MEAGFPYSSDCLPDLSVWADMLDKSPIKYIPQVCGLPLCYVPVQTLGPSSLVLSTSCIQVKTPLLLMLGQEDRRVPFKQGMEYYRALKARNVPVR